MSRCCSCEHHEGSSVGTSTHEGAVVCTFRFSLPDPREEALEKMACFIRRLGESIAGSGGFIGHVKATASVSGECIRYSLTGGKLDILPAQGTVTEAEGVAIVFRMEEIQLKKLVITGICETIHSDYVF